MKRILFDFITLQDNIINGGLLYTQKILYEILNNKVIIYGLYDGNLLINERTKTIAENHKITLLNIREEKIFETINGLQIDTFFVGIAQRYNFFDLCDLKCKIVLVTTSVGGDLYFQLTLLLIAYRLELLLGSEMEAKKC
jgi:hypothetical protein